MKRKITLNYKFVLLICSCFIAIQEAQATELLPSWNEGATRQAIIDFVENVSDQGSEQFVPITQRVAVFDNDGTLWSEQPVYFQLAFTFDRIKTLAPKHPEWKEKQPYKAVLEGNIKTAMSADKKSLLEMLMVAHAVTLRLNLNKSSKIGC